MDKYQIVQKIEDFAPSETAESWDCSGWLVETNKSEINKIMLALTVTDNIIKQAKIQGCDMLISHHPMFSVPTDYRDIDIYCAHTNMDLADGGTTDSLISKIEQYGVKIKSIEKPEGFVRYINTDISHENLCSILSHISTNFRYIKPEKNYKKIALCAGSGSEFIKEAGEYGADCYITGDMKFHTALDSRITVFDIGHFESEIQILDVFKNIIGDEITTVKAEEKSPFIYFS